WSWVSLMHPHRLIFSFLAGAQINLVVALTTIVGWLVTTKSKVFRINPTVVLIVLLGIWVTVATMAQIGESERGWSLWDRTEKTLIWAVMLQLIMVNKVRLHAIVWIAVLSLGYYG